jgi:hypothetical protein
MASALAVQAITRQNAAITLQHPIQSHPNLHSSSRAEDLGLLLRQARPRGRCRRQLPRQLPRRRLRRMCELVMNVRDVTRCAVSLLMIIFFILYRKLGVLKKTL